jgi:hypothetical protein
MWVDSRWVEPGQRGTPDWLGLKITGVLRSCCAAPRSELSGIIGSAIPARQYERLRRERLQRRDCQHVRAAA